MQLVGNFTFCDTVPVIVSRSAWRLFSLFIIKTLVLSINLPAVFSCGTNATRLNSSHNFYQRCVMTVTSAPPDSNRKMIFKGEFVMAVQVAGNLQSAKGIHHLLLVQLQNISENKKKKAIWFFLSLSLIQTSKQWNKWKLDTWVRMRADVWAAVPGQPHVLISSLPFAAESWRFRGGQNLSFMSFGRDWEWNCSIVLFNAPLYNALREL